jgi:hypothetical protein
MRSSLALSVAATACSLSLSSVGFDIPYSIPMQTAPGNQVANMAGVAVNVTLMPIPLNINLAQDEQQSGTSGVITTVTLTSLSFTIDQGSGCVDFVDSISLSIESTKSGSSLPSAVVATGSNPGCVQTFALTPTTVNLQPYFNEGAQVVPTVSGVPPASDVTFDGQLTAHAAL